MFLVKTEEEQAGETDICLDTDISFIPQNPQKHLSDSDPAFGKTNHLLIANYLGFINNLLGYVSTQFEENN